MLPVKTVTIPFILSQNIIASFIKMRDMSAISYRIFQVAMALGLSVCKKVNYFEFTHFCCMELTCSVAHCIKSSFVK